MESSVDLSHLEPYHFKQFYNWDCGLACLLMADRILENEPSKHHDPYYYGFNHCIQMVYTIDLYDFLATHPSQSRKRVVFTTTELGLAEGHGQLVSLYDVHQVFNRRIIRGT